MLFNSASFLLFLPFIFVLHWLLAKKNVKYQNIILLIASYYFYSCWDWRFLGLLAFSTLLDYFSAIKIEKTESRQLRKLWLTLSIFINLGFLLYFKYFNFFIDSFSEGLQAVGIEVHSTTLSIVLPVGISFYTFHGLSYIIDVYRNRIKAEHKLIDYSLFVSFFPLLVAGPIERATHLLPQVKKTRSFNYSEAILGLRQILWGLFKKIVIADNCAIIVNDIFSNYEVLSGSSLFLGAVFFSFQIYGDFSGYSDIAIGTARLFGINLLKNFAFPYFSRDIAEFWRRWHISLTKWFRDYLYIPIGGSRGGTYLTIRNTLIIFLVSGFWHGANFTFIFWGLLNALYFLPLILLKNHRKNIEIVAKDKIFPSFRELFNIVITFTLCCFAWIFFRSDTIEQAFIIFDKIFSMSFFIVPISVPKSILLLLTFFITIEWFGREKEFAIDELLNKWKKPVRFGFYYFILILIFIFMPKAQQFIYFQF